MMKSNKTNQHHIMGMKKNLDVSIREQIILDNKTHNLVGCDEIIKEKDSKPLNFSIRFHFYPGLTAVKTIER